MRTWTARGVRVGCIAAVIAAAATCARSQSVTCDDGRQCPVNTRCVEVRSDLYACAFDDQFPACDDRETGAACMLGAQQGTCFDGACILAACGDGILTHGELCDDGNVDGGDGCSERCDSIEICGDGVVGSRPVGEQCDEGVVGLSGDGCSSTCTRELDLWRDVTPGLPGNRTAHAMATDPLDGVIVFGGRAGSGSGGTVLGDHWRYVPPTWHRITPPTGGPSRRIHAAIGYDRERKVVVLVGGADADNQVLGDVWEWDGIQWTEVERGPSPRQQAAFACGRSRCVLVGGAEANGGAMSDAWEWDGTTWTQIEEAPTPARRLGTMAYDVDRDRFVLFGGLGPQSPPNLNDTWELSGDTWSPIVGTSPPAFPGVMAYDEATDQIVLAVNGTTWTRSGSTWTSSTAVVAQASPQLAYDRQRMRVIRFSQQNPHSWSGNAWQVYGLVEPLGIPRAISMVYDARRGRTILFEGTQTLEWDGDNWRRTQTVVGAPPGQHAAMTFDERCGRAMVFGGGQGSQASAMLSAYDGAWSTVPQMGARPQARADATLGYHAATDTVVLVGGLDVASLVLGDVWAWSGSGACTSKAWHEITGVVPPARSAAAIAYDPVRAELVLFGGAGINGPLDDTWVWDGTAWTERRPMRRPTERADHAMTYDARRGGVVLFGGEAGTLAYADTWLWNGTTWVELDAPVTPPVAAGHGIAPDARGGLITVGTGIAANPRVWRLRASASGSAAEMCRFADDDSDGDSLAGCDDPDCRERCAPLCPFATPFASCPTDEPRCGDGECTQAEDFAICPSDCPR